MPSCHLLQKNRSPPPQKTKTTSANRSPTTSAKHYFPQVSLCLTDRPEPESMRTASSGKYSRSRELYCEHRRLSAFKTPAKTTGLRYWMQRVLEDADHAEADFSADPVHDLRVALRL